MRSRGYPGIFPPLQVRCSTGNCLTLCVFHKNCLHLNSTFPNRLSLPECQFKILEADSGIISKSHYIHNIITQTILWTCSMASAFLILSLYFVPWHWTPTVLLSWGWQKQHMMKRDLMSHCCSPALSQAPGMPKQLSAARQQHILQLAAQLAHEREGGQLMPPLPSLCIPSAYKTKLTNLGEN